MLSGAIGCGRGVLAWSASSVSVLGVIFRRRAGVCSIVSLSSSRQRLRVLQSDGRSGRSSIHCVISFDRAMRLCMFGHERSFSRLSSLSGTVDKQTGRAVYPALSKPHESRDSDNNRIILDCPAHDESEVCILNTSTLSFFETVQMCRCQVLMSATRIQNNGCI